MATVEPRNVCVVTGSRAEYGLLSPVMREIRSQPLLHLQLVVTGTHLSPAHGETWRVIARDGFSIDERVDLGLDSDAGAGLARAAGRGVTGFAEAFSRLEPGMIVLLGDRYEILTAALAALLMGIPIAHIAGGDVTEGAFDDAIRHSLTKLSHLHFVTTPASARRVRQLGEEAHRIVVSGSTGIDVIRETPLLSREDLGHRLGFRLRKRNLLVTFHPVTLGSMPGEKQFDELLAALDALGADTGLIFTAPNADPGAAPLRARLATFIAGHPSACLHESLGQLLYLSAMHHCDAVVGNSSSGLYEAPALKKPTVNVGDRQQGRERAASVIDCPPARDAITAALAKAYETDCSAVESPYGDGHAASRIVSHLVSFPDWQTLLRKRFIDLPMAG